MLLWQALQALELRPKSISLFQRLGHFRLVSTRTGSQMERSVLPSEKGHE